MAHNDTLLYRHLAMAGGLVLIAGLFVRLPQPRQQEIFDMTYHGVALLTVTFASLWMHSRLTLTGLLFYFAGINLLLLQYPFPAEIGIPITGVIKDAALFLNGAGFLLILAGMVVETPPAPQKKVLQGHLLIPLVIALTLLIQIVARHL